MAGEFFTTRMCHNENCSSSVLQEGNCLRLHRGVPIALKGIQMLNAFGKMSYSELNWWLKTVKSLFRLTFKVCFLCNLLSNWAIKLYATETGGRWKNKNLELNKRKVAEKLQSSFGEPSSHITENESNIVNLFFTKTELCFVLFCILPPVHTKMHASVRWLLFDPSNSRVTSLTCMWHGFTATSWKKLNSLDLPTSQAVWAHKSANNISHKLFKDKASSIEWYYM